MRQERKQMLEQQGYTVIQKETLDSYWNTDTFLSHPNGLYTADYTSLSDIPILDDQTQISIDPMAFPFDDQTGFYTGQINGGAILYAQEQASANGLPIGEILMWIAIMFVAAAVLTCIFLITNALHPDPICKQEPRQQDIGNCAKLIVMPNCDTRTFNPCTGEWIDSSWTSHSSGTDWVTLLIIGGISIVGIYVFLKILPGLFRRSPPQYARAPGIDYVQ
jgi:hypothetical protein